MGLQNQLPVIICFRVRQQCVAVGVSLANYAVVVAHKVGHTTLK